jgi:hypothetical protein
VNLVVSDRPGETGAVPPESQESLPFADNEAFSRDKSFMSVNGYADLDGLLARQKITDIVLTADPHNSPELRNSLFACLPLKLNYFSLPNFYESITGRVPIESLNQMWFLENLSEGSKSWFDSAKRACDIVLAGLSLAVSSPILALVSLAIKLDSPGPVFFRQTRVGKNNSRFEVFKFRTMDRTVKPRPRIPTAALRRSAVSCAGPGWMRFPSSSMS